MRNKRATQILVVVVMEMGNEETVKSYPYLDRN